jgi:hypothetical protein
LGVKDTKEVITLAKVVTCIILKEAYKDGFQWKDLGSFLQSPAFEAALRPAVEGIQNVAPELLDLDFFETIELSRHVYGQSMDVLDTLKDLAK